MSCGLCLSFKISNFDESLEVLFLKRFSNETLIGKTNYFRGQTQGELNKGRLLLKLFFFTCLDWNIGNVPLPWKCYLETPK